VSSTAPAEIVVRGAREHNLRGVDLRIPRDRLVVITGLSGSGKSSLAFDTLYAEGQRRYVESLSVYARQFLDQMKKPDVEAIDGLSPAIAIEQRNANHSRRSTVGTATEILDHLRLLYARAGEPHCWTCGRPISTQSPEQIAERLMKLPEATRAEIRAPVVRGRKGTYKKELASFRRQGFTRVRIDGKDLDLSEEIELVRNERHDIELLVDRVLVRRGVRPRATESIVTALRLGDGHLVIDVGPGEDQWWLGERNACVECGNSFPELAPRLFSFNSGYGACPGCSGLGTRAVFDPDRIVPDPNAPLSTAIAPWTRGGRTARYYRHLLQSLAEHFAVSPNTPWQQLPKKIQKGILWGTREPVLVRFGRGRRKRATREWDGVVGELERRRQSQERDDTARYAAAASCDVCGGTRLRAEARAVHLGGRSIDQLCALPLGEAAAFLDGLELSGLKARIAERVLREVRERLRFLCDVGLDYLSLDRPSASLSGGESQRIRLATQVGAQLMGVLYVLDEPSIGLHPRDNARLLESLRRLEEQGNSVVLVEHDEQTIRAADWVIDMGPGAGVHGGEVVAEGPPEAIAEHPGSPTGAFLSGRRSVPVPEVRRTPSGTSIELSGCREHNLRALDVEFPLGLLLVVTGVSGSGKSTLIHDTLYRALARELYRSTAPVGAHASIQGFEHLDKVILVDQQPIGRTPRSNAATYTGVFDGIRRLFAGVPESSVRGYGPGRFSFNVKGGRCEHCSGDGAIRVVMHFLPDLFVTCEACNGRRYNRETLEVRYREQSIADVLAMTVEEATAFAKNVPGVRRPLQTLLDVGLGYLHLGQSATTLSGGEAQRIKLAKELSKRATGRTLYILDEPTTGLHFADVECLLAVLQRLVDAGNTVVVIEHQIDVIKNADWVIDLGPEGGAAGGAIVAAGAPEQIARCQESHTGRALAAALTP
jgi:excinuclease ABC subunit A